MRTALTGGETRPRSILRTTARGIAVTAVAMTLALMTGAPASADALTDRQKQLAAAIAVSNTALTRASAQVDDATQKLAESESTLKAQQQLLSQAIAARDAAAQRDQEMAAALQAAEQQLATAKVAVTIGEQHLTAQRRLVALSLNQNTQQNSQLQQLAVLTTNLGVGDVNNRIQWATEALTVTQREQLRLTELQNQLIAAQKEQASATTRVEQKREAAGAQLAVTQTLEQEAQSAADAVAATVKLRAAAAADAKAQLAAKQQNNTSLKSQKVKVDHQIAQRIAAAKAAAAKAARERAARAAAARRAAALAAQRAAERAAAAAARAEAARQRAAASADNSSSRSATRAPISTSYSLYSNGGSWTPGSYSSVPNYGGVDPWGFYWGECVSYTAFKVRTTTRWTDFINNYTARGRSVHFGNAVEWGAAAQAIGIPVNTHPSVGSIAWRTSGSAGHVAYVTAVHSDGTIDVAEYNYSYYHGFDVRTHVAWWNGGSGGFAGFIHFEA